MKRLFLIFTLVFATGYLFDGFAQEAVNKTIVGSWKYEVSQAPYGFESGTIIISKDKENLLGEVNFVSGYSVKLQNLSLKSDTLRAAANVEGENISITAKMVKNKLQGKVDTSMGVMGIKADRVMTTSKK
ncbi:MAG: hypothetical protein GXZ03_06200 [Proteiniphilum sp.]|nr:hypothetical protein [Proteiniphilum sp.]